ncbi:hypothetical protein Mal4_32180 [Maioricimonas rarisocia]|uniref:Uncharacterized protein n=1 Tax=Maioricimonas rarisocia TaxID=2528026 RepID=A0A517Z8V5_9PLAN|nr:hypothetical protein Mal4_32180 [Maioricimonas rarisocia]
MSQAHPVQAVLTAWCWDQSQPTVAAGMPVPDDVERLLPEKTGGAGIPACRQATADVPMGETHGSQSRGTLNSGGPKLAARRYSPSPNRNGSPGISYPGRRPMFTSSPS